MKLRLLDYKGKFTIAQDMQIPLGREDYQVGLISKDEFLKQTKERTIMADYYGVPVYYGNDPEIISEIKKFQK